MWTHIKVRTKSFTLILMILEFRGVGTRGTQVHMPTQYFEQLVVKWGFCLPNILNYTKLVPPQYFKPAVTLPI